MDPTSTHPVDTLDALRMCAREADSLSGPTIVWFYSHEDVDSVRAAVSEKDGDPSPALDFASASIFGLKLVVDPVEWPFPGRYGVDHRTAERRAQDEASGTRAWETIGIPQVEE